MATAEARVINSVIKNQDRNALFGHSVDDLFDAYGDVWAYLKDYHNKFNGIPPLEVVQERFPDLDDVEVNGKTEYYLDTLKNEYRHTKLENLLIRAGKEMSPETSEFVVNKLQEALFKLNRFSASGRDLDLMDTDEALRRYDEVRARAEAMGGTPGVPTGVDFIDSSMVLGMQGGDLISFIGYPGRGKSALAALVTAKIIKRGYKPLYVSLEMSAEAVQDRVYTIMGSGLFSNTELMLGQINVDDFREFSSKTSGKGWVIDGNGGAEMTPNAIRAKIEQHRPDVVILDYLQLLHDNRLTDDMTGRMRNLSLELKHLANACNVPIIVISSATPDGGAITGPPNVERSAWSRQLAYDSTVSVAVHRHDDTSLYEIVCAKNRYGPLFWGLLDWDMDRGIVVERFDSDLIGT